MSNPYEGAIVGRLKLKGKALKKWGGVAFAVMA